MAICLKRFRKDVISSVCKERAGKPQVKDIDRKIVLGVLLRAMGAVAEADGVFLGQEAEKIKQILRTYLKISEQDFPIVLTAIRQATMEGIDLHQFVNAASEKLPYKVKISIIEDLFRVACVDKNLDHTELEVIKKAADLFGIIDQDFVKVKQMIKGEFGL